MNFKIFNYIIFLTSEESNKDSNLLKWIPIIISAVAIGISIWSICRSKKQETVNYYLTIDARLEAASNRIVDLMREYSKDKSSDIYVDSIEVGITNYLNIYDAMCHDYINNKINKKSFHVKYDKQLLELSRDELHMDIMKKFQKDFSDLVEMLNIIEENDNNIN